MANNAPDLNPLDEAAVAAIVEAALSDIAAADSLDALKTVRLAVMGDNAPLVLANRTIGGLDPKDRGAAGKNLGGARGQITQALTLRQDVLQAAHDAQVLVDEAVDVTVPTRRVALGARHPLETLMEEVACGSRRRRAAQAGLNGAGVAWSIPTSCVLMALTRTNTPASPSVWVLNVP